MGHRLLPQQKLHTKALDVPLLLVDLLLQLSGPLPQPPVPGEIGLGRVGDGLLAQGAHGDQRLAELLQLFVKTVSHGYPNLPVM